MSRLGRRGAGISALHKKKEAKNLFESKAEEIESEQFEYISKALSSFKANLETFAQKHKKEINRNPQFRAQFQRMCSRVGVDPLASNKGFWAEILGVGDFYYELSVQIIQICLSTRKSNGGLIGLDELMRRLQFARSRAGKTSQMEISTDDVRRAIGKVKSLGTGFGIIQVGEQQMVVSVPVELNFDHIAVLNSAVESYYVTISGLKKEFAWTEERIHQVLDLMLKEGMAWIDEQSGEGEIQYWFPSLFTANQ